jgi:AcrR family transcriptional regulator
MANLPRWRRRKEDRPTEIVAAALEAFAERGYAATRLEDVAERAGVSKGTLYLYFKSKEELFKAVVQQALVPNLAMAETLVKESPMPTRDLLVHVLRGLATAVAGTKIGAIPRLVIAEANNFPELARFYADEVVARGMRIFAAILERGAARGELRPVNTEFATPVVIGPMMLLAIWKTVLEPHTERKIDPVRYLETCADVLLNGLAVPKGQGD